MYVGGGGGNEISPFPLPYTLSRLSGFTRVNEEDLLQQNMSKK